MNRSTASVFVAVTAGWLSACGSSGAPAPVAAPTMPDAAPIDSGAASERDAYAKKNNLILKQYDLNRDGIPDDFKFYREVDDPKNQGNKLEQLLRKDLDINHDGKIDIIRIYDDKGLLTEERVDLDFDGRFDAVNVNKEGVLSRQEIDLNFDGKPDITKYFDGGQLSRVESDRNGDGRVETWEYYQNGELDRVGTDNDMDGTADTWERKKQQDAPPAGTQPANDSAKPTPS